MQFEFDEWKSRANVDKHGIDFVAAQALWRDPGLLWTAVYTLRSGAVRIISVRRSRTEEVGVYETQEG